MTKPQEEFLRPAYFVFRLLYCALFVFVGFHGASSLIEIVAARVSGEVSEGHRLSGSRVRK